MSISLSSSKKKKTNPDATSFCPFFQAAPRTCVRESGRGSKGEIERERGKRERIRAREREREREF